MAVKRWNGTSWEIYAGSDLAPVKVTDGRVGKTTFIGATTPTGMVDGDIWIDQDTATNAVVPTALLAKGDIFVATASGAYTRLAAGNNGEQLYADSSTSTGLRWQGDYSVGKNKVINGDFSIWQRGSTFNSPSDNSFSADRWVLVFNGAGATRTITRETFTPGSAPVAGYEGQYFLRYNQSVAGSGAGYNTIGQRIEDVRVLAGQIVTLSFWAKAASNVTLPFVNVVQRFGGGGSSENLPLSATNANLTTSWQRFSYTFSMPSISGKTIGTNSYTLVEFYTPLNAISTIDLWGVQLEAGSTATQFQTATGTIQGELAACQRYYQRLTGNTSNSVYFATGVAISTTRLFANYQSPVAFRSAPSVAHSSGKVGNGVISNQSITSISNYANAGLSQITIDTNVASGLTSSGAFMLVCDQNAYIELSSEL